MHITNDTDLELAVKQVSVELQEIQDYLGREINPKGKISFPRGFIRTAAAIRSALPTLSDDDLLRNISYSIIMTDVLRWLGVRTNLQGTGKEMVVKTGIFLLGSVCESLIRDILVSKKLFGVKHSYKERTKKLVDLGVIEASLKTELDWLWDTRNNAHLFLVGKREHEFYSAPDYNRGLNAYRQLCVQLKAKYG